MEEVPETELEKGKGRDGQEEEGKGDQRKQGADKEESKRMIGKKQEHKKHGKGDRKVAQGPRKRVKVLKNEKRTRQQCR
jgi:hypothetical protein